MKKIDAIISRTPILINSSNEYMQIKVEDFHWLMEQARTVEAISLRIGEEEEALQKSRDLKQKRTALENNKSSVLTTGQMVDTLKIGEIARSNEDTYVYRQAYGFIWCEEDGSYPCNKYFQINDLTLKLKWTIKDMD